MTERLHAAPYGSFPHGDARRVHQSSDEGLGTKKTMLVLVVVVGCFAVLWPKLFYPMLVNNANNQMRPGPVDKTTGCCDVISELDFNTIKIMSELCSTIIESSGKTPLTPKDIVTQCRKAVLETCGIDISVVLQDRIVSMGHSVKQILEEIRSLNGSLCLKYNFGLSPWRLGVPHRVNINLDPVNSIRQERPAHLRSEMVHPAFKERGRAIPQSDVSGIPKRSGPPPRIIEGRPGPIPGMRPAMGGPGHVVPPSKQSNYGFMGILMPIYTIGFVVFFTYTVMKLVFKKKSETHVGAPLYPPCDTDERFHKEVFEANKNYFHRPSRDSSKIGDEELDQLRKRLRETELAMERIVEQMAQAPLVTQDEIKANGTLPKEEDQGSVKIMGMETTASCESGRKWSRPDSPVLPHPPPAAPKEPSPPPQQIFLEGTLPPQSQILVAESATESQRDAEDDSPVVLAGKMTLSVISLDSEAGTEDSSNSGKKAEASEEERRTSSSNVSEEFEKINAADLEEQIDNIIEEAENIALTEENRYSLDEELDKLPEELPKAPQLNEKDKDNDVLEEIKNQLNLEDDLLLALKEKEVEGKVSLPVTDIIKEFLNNEENALLGELKGIEIGEIREENTDILERSKRSLSEERHREESNDMPSNVSQEEENELNQSESKHATLLEVKEMQSHISNNKKDEESIKNGTDTISLNNKNDFTQVIEENEKITEDRSSSIQQEEEQEESDSPVQETHESSTEIQRQESLNGKNKADLLLQGLLVKDNVELDEEKDISNTASSLVTQDHEKVDDSRTETLVKDDSVEAEEEQEEPLEAKEDSYLTKERLVVQDESTLHTDTPATEIYEDYDEESEEEEEEEEDEDDEELDEQNTNRDENVFRAIDAEDRLIDDEDYDEDSGNEDLDDEVRDINREALGERSESMEGRLNGADSSRNGATNSETAAENEISDEEDLEDEENDDEEEEVEEIIEYVDNSDEEGEEIIEINGNERVHSNENGQN